MRVGSFDFEDDDFDGVDEVSAPVSVSSGVSAKVRLRTVEEVVSGNVTSALALDVSKKSTGFAYVRDGKVVTGNIKFGIKDYESPHAVGIMIKTLRDDILSIVGVGSHLDLICIEEALLGINADTSSVAYALNFVIDTLIADGLLSYGRFIRIENSSWKSTLRQFAGVESMRTGSKKTGNKNTDKLEVIQSLKNMNFPLAFRYDEFKSWTAYERSGVQDRLDAVGLMVACTLRFIENGEKRVLKRERKVKIFEDEQSALKFALHDVVYCEKVSANSVAKWTREVGEELKETKSYIMKTNQLGRLGIQHGIFVKGDAYIVVNVKYYTD